MGYHRLLTLLFATASLISLASTRAVNISNTWMLPEEGFPVFYRYFRDRISWYEADAVCQFHHANLVTADTTSQYDAIRAYLKELDIADTVWIGLTKASSKSNFGWTDFRPLSGDGHWQEAIPIGNDALCVTMDPAADFLWKARSCGGPEVAAFICELPIPTWATNCLVTELPSLTVLYIPEHSAVELTSDCGLDGTKRIACKGNNVEDREDIRKLLTCAISHEDFDDKSTKSPIQSSTGFDVSSDETSLSSKTTKPWIWTSNTIDTDYGMPTRHRRETDETPSPQSTKSTTDLSTKESVFRKTKKPTTTTETVTNSPTNYDTELTSTTPSDSDTTLDLSVSRESDKSGGLIATQAADVATQDGNSQPEEQTETFVTAAATADTKVADTAGEEAGEFPSAINQGQLFSIIENGTMFDIIELNETGSEEPKPKNIALLGTHPHEVTPSTSSIPPSSTESLYTTVVYNKEPPSEKTFVTNKSIKNLDKVSKKDMYKNSDPKKANYVSKTYKNDVNVPKTEKDKELSKEVELFSIISDPSPILNRTNRKEVPFEDEPNALDRDIELAKIDNAIFPEDKDKHQHIEIKLEGKDQTLLVTTKRSGNKAQQPKELGSFDNIETLDEAKASSTEAQIDPKIDILNTNVKINNDSEVLVLKKPEKIEKVPDESMLMKEQFLPKSLTEGEPTEAEPEAQPRPNRQRQLTRPQRRSFYPNFFSRVLG